MPIDFEINPQLSRHRVISLVGGGGKTTLMFRMAREFSARGKRVISTTTTKIHYPRAQQTGAVILTQSAGTSLPDQLERQLAEKGHITLAAGELLPKQKLQGIRPGLVGRLSEQGIADHIIVEADGAARKPFKAPADHEPALPSATSLLIAVVGLDVVGKPLDAQWVHRPEAVGQLTGLVPGEVIQEDHVATVSAHPRGLMKDLPPGAAGWVFLNKADEPGRMDQAREIAGMLIRRGRRQPRKVIIGAAAQKEWIQMVYEMSEGADRQTPEAGS